MEERVVDAGPRGEERGRRGARSGLGRTLPGRAPARVDGEERQGRAQQLANGKEEVSEESQRRERKEVAAAPERDSQHRDDDQANVGGNQAETGQVEVIAVERDLLLECLRGKRREVDPERGRGCEQRANAGEAVAA